jgi:O-antigen ligase
MTAAAISGNESFAKFVHVGFLISLSAVVFFLPLKIHFANISVGFAAGFWCLNFRQNAKVYNPALKVPLLVFTSVYWLHVAGMLYTDNLITGLQILEKKLVLLAFPLLFIVSVISKKEIDKILSVFVIGVLISCSICYFDRLTTFSGEDRSLFAFMTDPDFQNIHFSEAIPIHPAYLSACVILSSLILLERIYRANVMQKVVYILLVIFFIITTLILMARGSLFALAAIIILSLFFKLIYGKVTARLAYSIGMICALIVACFFFIPNLKSRMTESFGNYEENVSSSDQVSSVALHFKSWHCAIVSTLNKHIVFGHGTGDEEEVLKNCYTANGWHSMAEGGYDAHNEYLSALVRHGIIGLLIFLSVLAYSFYWSIRFDNLVYFSFLVLIAVTALSESILRGQVPVLFFAFFNSCLYKVVLLRRIERGSLVSAPLHTIKSSSS